MKQYDFAIGWSGNIEEDFVRFIQSECKNNSLSFFWINEDNVREALKDLESNKISIKVVLRLSSSISLL